ncbi:MAG: leucyl aminopeptidase family protein [Gammaproteobacteria bacterium]|nr:leucyl aminopeptidase family protein [Gammaproteobacteria bacterium]
MLIFETDDPVTPITLVGQIEFAGWREAQSETHGQWLDNASFEGRANQYAWLPDDDGRPSKLVAGTSERITIESLGELAFKLPEGVYQLDAKPGGRNAALSADDRYDALLGWALGAYRFRDYKASDREAARLLVRAKDSAVLDELEAINLCRDLINTPTSDMLPHDLEAAARKLATAFDATIGVTVGDELLRKRFNTIHAVGRASASAPRLIDITWGDPSHPKVTLVGKGVCFDSGGLDIKTAAGMRLMKKDMGGGAHALGLARLIMSRGLPVYLRTLVPAVENAISSNAYRPGDILRSYKGLTIEIENTDAEGRLILCDALTLAAEDKPALIVDFATLTGAARAALGTELPAMFTNDDDVANAIIEQGLACGDPVWRLPLHKPYDSMLDSKIADVANAASSPYGGAITAALFLQRFVDGVPWVHFDIMGLNNRSRPAHPEGGEAFALRAVYRYIEQAFTG